MGCWTNWPRPQLLTSRPDSHICFLQIDRDSFWVQNKPRALYTSTMHGCSSTKWFFIFCYFSFIKIFFLQRWSLLESTKFWKHSVLSTRSTYIRWSVHIHPRPASFPLSIMYLYPPRPPYTLILAPLLALLFTLSREGSSETEGKLTGQTGVLNVSTSSLKIWTTIVDTEFLQ